MQKATKILTLTEAIKERLCTLFLHCIFINPEFIKGEISKHLEIPKEDVSLSVENVETDENGNEVCKVYKLGIFGVELKLRYIKRVEEPREIEVPKIVKLPRKWYEYEPETMVVTEKKKIKQTFHWVLDSIEY